MEIMLYCSSNACVAFTMSFFFKKSFRLCRCVSEHNQNKAIAKSKYRTHKNVISINCFESPVESMETNKFFREIYDAITGLRRLTKIAIPACVTFYVFLAQRYNLQLAQ